ncbi:MAG: 2,3,4,5-tetrahydropyridine-2,6-dicarboxylate N-acetyltransferase [Brevinema sp.]
MSHKPTSSEELIAFIKNSEKKTHVRCWVKGKLPQTPEGIQHFEGGSLYVGDWEKLAPFLKQHENAIEDSYIEIDRRNSGVPTLDYRHTNARIEPGAVIRDKVTIGDRAVIMMGALINIGAEIGEGTMIDMGAILGGRAIVGKNCHIGAGAVLAGVIEPPSATPVIVEDDVLIGANAVVVEGIRIGKGAVVGAGAVVLEDVPAGAVAAGNPAKIIKQVDDKTKNKTQIIDDLRK